MSVDPVRDTLVMYMEQASYGAQTGTFQVELHGLLAHLIIVAHRFLLRCEVPAASSALVSL